MNIGAINLYIYIYIYMYTHTMIHGRKNIKCQCSVSEDSGVLRCAAVSLGEWLATFSKDVVFSS